MNKHPVSTKSCRVDLKMMMMMLAENVRDQWDQEQVVHVKLEAEHEEPQEDESASYSINHNVKAQKVQ